jgi:hypothetical protein
MFSFGFMQTLWNLSYGLLSLEEDGGISHARWIESKYNQRKKTYTKRVRIAEVK